MLRAALEHAGCNCSDVQIGALLRPARMASIRATVWDAWRASMPEHEEESAASSRGKPLTWLEAWAIADQDLGLTADEWLAMTPRMVQALIARRMERTRQLELMIGMVIANNANYSSCAPKEPLLPERFMLHPWPKEKPKPLDGGGLMAAFSEYRTKGLIKNAISQTENRRR